jgi:hypothetical protein
MLPIERIDEAFRIAHDRTDNALKRCRSSSDWRTPTEMTERAAVVSALEILGVR